MFADAAKIVDGQIHMYVAEMAENCGLSTWLTNSMVAHVAADSPTKVFHRVDTAVEPWAHNPEIDIVPALPNSSESPLYLLLQMGNGTVTKPVVNCDGGSSAESTRWERQLTQNSSFTIDIHSSSSPNGPWTSNKVVLNGVGELGNWNPTAVVLPNGTARMMILCNKDDGIRILEAASWRGPYNVLTPEPAVRCSIERFKWCVEDGFIYQDTRGHWHSLFHMFDFPNATKLKWSGGHAFSRDGIIWSNVSQAYNTTVEVKGNGSAPGQVLFASRRERPKLLFNAAGEPTHLFNGVQLGEYRWYTMAQELRTTKHS